MPALLTVEDYLAQVLTLTLAPASGQTVPLDAALGRVLAVDVAAAVSVPPFDNSAMDGYAVRAADLAVVPVSLTVVGESAAVSGPIPRVVPEQCGASDDRGTGADQGRRWCRSSRPIE
ncbi:MAG: hypothetical protein R2742_15620 [Micropruina glycogenica]